VKQATRFRVEGVGERSIVIIASQTIDMINERKVIGQHPSSLQVLLGK